ncbi:MAG: circularly permuted type 2 ATP-grasp protein [Candidatus Tectimicrobiota bacterium]
MDKHALIERYNDLLEHDGALRRASYERLAHEMASGDIRFGDDIVPTFMRPFFISEAEDRLIKAAVETTMGCAEKLLHLAVTNPEVLKYLELSEAERELFAIPHGYEKTAVICRLDGFLLGERLRFLELNSDTPAGMGYTDVMAEIFLSLPVFEQLRTAYQYHYIKTRTRLLEVLLSCYRQFGGRETPTIALMGWRGLRTRPEFHLIKEAFEDEGYPTVICDPRELEVSRGHLTFEGRRVHLIYRKVLTNQFLGKIDELQAVLKAYREGTVCMVNPFSSKLLSFKAILYFLTDPQFMGHFTVAEQKALKRYLSWTRRVAPGRVWYRGRHEDLLPLIRTAKDRFVIKPSDAFGGKGVAIGRETDQARWEAVIDEALKGRWVVQESIEIPEELFPAFTPERGLRTKKVNLNPFAFGSRYAGCVARISRSSIINVSVGGGILPVIQARPT